MLSLFLKRELWTSSAVEFVDMMWDSFNIYFPTCDISGWFENIRLYSYHGKAVCNVATYHVSWKHCKAAQPMS
jgi:hypothetical protein